MTDHDTADGARRLSAIVFSDIVSYSKMMGEDEGNAMRVLQEHNELLVPMIQKARGRILKFMGDGIMSAFDSASDAVLCGVEIQKAVAERNKALPQKNHFLLRIGIHIGDVTEKNGDIFGDGVNIAARIQPLADPGGICISQTVYDIVRARREIRMVSLGPRELKNIKEAVHIYKVDVGDGLAASPAKAASWGALGGGEILARGVEVGTPLVEEEGAELVRAGGAGAVRGLLGERVQRHLRLVLTVALP
ncbi:MAG: adenylate/guanylate cyclase domain-containing protein, partial [Elusimicrobia bacterium]|nr:adenylate/guanylate cyclase domain-containing protein [Elusimicrobiota bacterium]